MGRFQNNVRGMNNFSTYLVCCATYPIVIEQETSARLHHNSGQLIVGYIMRRFAPVVPWWDHQRHATNTNNIHTLRYKFAVYHRPYVCI